MTDLTRTLDALEFAHSFFKARAHMATPGSEGAGKLYECANGCADALELLKAQEPVPPIIEVQIEDTALYFCGTCRSRCVGIVSSSGLGRRDDFCANCGRAVKWDA